MKREPTINIQDEVVKIHAQYGMTEMANYHIEKLFEKHVKQSSPKIKQLEWEDNKNCLTKGITARTSFCTYQTMELSNGNSSLFTDNRIICQDFPIDYIKQYAQEDFEARVKECLIIE